MVPQSPLLQCYILFPTGLEYSFQQLADLCPAPRGLFYLDGYPSPLCYNVILYFLQAWSIAFHSWLTFVLLLGACFIWMVPQSRRACLLCSPIIMFYGEALLIIQYVYGQNLTKDELPETVGTYRLEEIGLIRYQYPCLPLAIQVLKIKKDYKGFWPDCKAIPAYGLMMSVCLSVCPSVCQHIG